jgi:protein SCO1/2
VPARIQLALIALLVCAAAGLAGALLAQGKSNGPGLELVNGWAGAQRPPGQPVPDFALKDQDGNIVTSASLRGKPVVYAFVYSTCKDTCPAQVQTIRGALDDLGHDVPVIGISVDPAHDTPKLATTFLLAQTMTRRMRFLLGTRAQLAPVWKAFAIQPQTNALEHSAHVVVADSQGFQRVGFPFNELTPDGLAHDIARLSRP